MLPLLTALALASAPLQATQTPAPPRPAPSTDAATRSAPVDPFAPDRVVSPPGGPRIVMLGPVSEGAAALRLSVPVEEGTAEAGFAHVLRRLAHRRVEGLARNVGASFSGSRTPWGLAYTVEGSVTDIEYLVYLLREAVSAPEQGGGVFRDAVRGLEEDRSRMRESPADRLSAQLRTLAAPGSTPALGWVDTPISVEPTALTALWRQSHRPERMTLVVSGDVAPEVVLAASQGLGMEGADRSGPLDASPLPPSGRQSVQTLRSWYGRVWAAETLDGPEGPVAALLVADHLARQGEAFETGVELWELPGTWALAVRGAAYQAGASRLRAAVSTAVAGTRRGLDADAVADAVARVRRDLYIRARTPSGLVSVVGRALDATGSPEGAVRYRRALDRLDRDAVDAFLGSLEAGVSVEAQVRR